MKEQARAPKILAAGAAVQLLTGIPAAWGVFQRPIMEAYAFTRAEATMVFALLVASYGVGCAVGGFVQDARGPRFAALWGTALLGTGFCWRLLRRRQRGRCSCLPIACRPGWAAHFWPRPCWPALKNGTPGARDSPPA